MFAAEHYANQLAQLLPPGKIWDDLRAQDSNAMLLLDAVAQEFARHDARADALLNETDPRSLLELITDWEDYLGLPDKCVGLGATLAQRREAVHAILTNTAGQSRQYFIGVAAELGFPDVAITEYDPHTVDASVDAPIYGIDWRFAWKLSAPQPDIEQFNADSSVDESLGEQSSTERLECVINFRKPAHTIALFEYL